MCADGDASHLHISTPQWEGFIWHTADIFFNAVHLNQPASNKELNKQYIGFNTE